MLNPDVPQSNYDQWKPGSYLPSPLHRCSALSFSFSELPPSHSDSRKRSQGQSRKSKALRRASVSSLNSFIARRLSPSRIFYLPTSRSHGAERRDGIFSPATIAFKTRRTLRIANSFRFPFKRWDYDPWHFEQDVRIGSPRRYASTPGVWIITSSGSIKLSTVM